MATAKKGATAKASGAKRSSRKAAKADGAADSGKLPAPARVRSAEETRALGHGAEPRNFGPGATK